MGFVPITGDDGMSPPEASIIVRTRDSARTVLETLASLQAQTARLEVVVVDSGSTDGTLDLVSGRVHQVVTLAPGDFSYGRALNIGAQAARSAVHVALSSHCVLPNAHWVSTAVATLADPGVAGTCSGDVDGKGAPLLAPLRADHRYLDAHPFWGFTNHASAWSARAWAEEPFDERLVACEDREWSWRVTRSGRVVVLDPRLHVPVEHRTAAGLRPYYARRLREVTAYAELGRIGPYRLSAVLRDLLLGHARDPFVNGSRVRGVRAAEALARWRGGRMRDAA